VSRAEQAAARRRERWILLVVLAGLVAVVVGGGVGLQAWRTGRAPTPVAAPAPSSAPVTIAAGQPVVLGDPSAPRVVTLFSDFHCPHCADFEEQFGPVLDEARRAGRIRVEVYPMAFVDDGSASAANAFACASEAGFGPGYFAGLFANPMLRWSDRQLSALPEAVGVTPTPTFERCVIERRHAGWVDSINAAAEQRGITATPSLLVDGAPVDLTELTPPDLAAMIDP
jgi:protein-disulfide isomerase